MTAADPPTSTTAATSDVGAIPLRKRPAADQLDYFGEKLATLIDPARLDRDALIIVGSAIVNLGVIATEVRKQSAELAELRARLGQPKVQHRAISHQLGTVVKLNKDDLRRRDEWIEGVRHEVRDVYATPWREYEEDDHG